MTVTEIVRLVAPEFQDVTDEVLAKWTELVSPLISKSKFGRFYEQAVAYLVCHKMKMAGLGVNELGELGKIAGSAANYGIASISEGSSSISFGANQQTNLAADAEYAMTSYGLQFLQLRKLCIVPITIDH